MGEDKRTYLPANATGLVSDKEGFILSVGVEPSRIEA